MRVLSLGQEDPLEKGMATPVQYSCLENPTDRGAWQVYGVAELDTTAGQEATVRTGHGTTDWVQIGKGVCQGCILSPCLFNLHAEYIMRNTGLEEAQAGIKITGRNTNNFKYADDTTFMAESEEELKSLLMKVKEEREKILA